MSTPNLISSGTYTIKGLFILVTQDPENPGGCKTSKAEEIDEFGTQTCELKEAIDLNEFIFDAIQKINLELPEYLKSKNIKRWLPFRNVTYKIKENVLSIAYYQNQMMYDKVYKSDPVYLLEPMGHYSKLSEYYNGYTLDIYSEEVYAKEDEDGE